MFQSCSSCSSRSCTNEQQKPSANGGKRDSGGVGALIPFFSSSVLQFFVNQKTRRSQQNKSCRSLKHLPRMQERHSGMDLLPGYPSESNRFGRGRIGCGSTANHLRALQIRYVNRIEPKSSNQATALNMREMNGSVSGDQK